MGDVLILTGWGYADYACSAALCLQKHVDADVFGTSRNSLSRHLSELAKGESGYRRILILGVSLLSDQEDLLKALKILKRRKIEIIWLSVFPLPPALDSRIADCLDVHVAVGCDTLAKACLEYCGLSRKSVRISGIMRLAENSHNNLNDADLAWITLFGAAASRYRRFQEREPYSEAIRSLAKGVAPNEKQRNMIEEYKRYGNRELKGASRGVAGLWKRSYELGKEGHCSVLIVGETGTGKETVAYLIHGHSPRPWEKFVPFNCADLSPQLLESRLFGHEKGAFTGAEKLRKGAFEQADGGTLFLDEVAELPGEAQAGLLRVLQEKRFRRLGGENDIEVDVRIIAATHRNLPNMMKEGKFREDLFFRLCVEYIEVPPLRDRTEDIPLIADDFMLKRGRGRLTQKQKETLGAYHWPGNVRELEHILLRSVIRNESDFQTLIAEHRKMLSSSSNPQSELLDDVVRAHAASILDKYQGNKTQAAKAMGISLNTLKKYLQ